VVVPVNVTLVKGPDAFKAEPQPKLFSRLLYINFTDYNFRPCEKIRSDVIKERVDTLSFESHTKLFRVNRQGIRETVIAIIKGYVKIVSAAFTFANKLNPSPQLLAEDFLELIKVLRCQRTEKLSKINLSEKK
jgi:hypothetical protein